MGTKLALFAILASIILLLGCAQQYSQEPEKPQAPAQQPATSIQKQPQEAESLSDLQAELDSEDASVQESITDLDSFQ